MKNKNKQTKKQFCFLFVSDVIVLNVHCYFVLSVDQDPYISPPEWQKAAGLCLFLLQIYSNAYRLCTSLARERAQRWCCSNLHIQETVKERPKCRFIQTFEPCMVILYLSWKYFNPINPTVFIFYTFISMASEWSALLKNLLHTIYYMPSVIWLIVYSFQASKRLWVNL